MQMLIWMRISALKTPHMQNFAKVFRFLQICADFCIILEYFALFHMFLDLYPHIFAFFADFYVDFCNWVKILMQISAIRCESKLCGGPHFYASADADFRKYTYTCVACKIKKNPQIPAWLYFSNINIFFRPSGPWATLPVMALRWEIYSSGAVWLSLCSHFPGNL